MLEFVEKRKKQMNTFGKESKKQPAFLEKIIIIALTNYLDEKTIEKCNKIGIT